MSLKDECLICKAPLIYLETEERRETMESQVVTG